jgi:hypothetical protein
MLKLPQQYKSLEFIRPMKWQDVFNEWRKGEAWQGSWEKHWTERGFVSWDEWREAYSVPLNPNSLSWFLYKIKDPVKIVSFFYGTPTKSWIKKAYGGEKTKRLSEIINLPIIKDNFKILEIKKNFPKQTMLTGLVHNGEIVLVEGMHRASALADWDAVSHLDSEITIALAEWSKEIPSLGGNYKNKQKNF